MNLARCVACLALALAVGLDALPYAPTNENVALSLGGGAFVSKAVTLRAASVGAAHFAVEESADISALFNHYSRHAAASLGLAHTAAKAGAHAARGISSEGTQHMAGISVDVKVGTPSQKQTILLHFLTSNLWLVGKKFPSSALISHRFDENASKTFHSTDEHFQFEKNDFNASGLYATDRFRLGALRLKQQRIGVADSAESLFQMLGVNGMLGLAAAADGSGQSALADLLKGASDPTVTFYHNPLATGFVGESNALFVTFGGANETLCKNDWKTVGATNDGSWQVDIYGISVGEKTHKTLKAEKALILSTLPVTLVPRHTLAHLVKTLSAVKVKGQKGVYTVECTGLPTIYFNLGDKRIRIEPENYVMEVGGVCFLAVLELSKDVSAQYGDVQFVLADPLLRSNCVKFDPQAKQISFATPIPQALD